MNYIVFDLEWNQNPEGKKTRNDKLPFEIIEIGAVKVNSRKEITITFNKIAVSVRKGEKFRLDITSSDYPAFNIHPNTTNLWSEETKPVKAVQKLYGGKIEF